MQATWGVVFVENLHRTMKNSKRRFTEGSAGICCRTVLLSRGESARNGYSHLERKLDAKGKERFVNHDFI